MIIETVYSKNGKSLEEHLLNILKQKLNETK